MAFPNNLQILSFQIYVMPGSSARSSVADSSLLRTMQLTNTNGTNPIINSIYVHVQLPNTF